MGWGWGGGEGPHSYNLTFFHIRSLHKTVFAQYAMITFPTSHVGQGITVPAHITSFEL